VKSFTRLRDDRDHELETEDPPESGTRPDKNQSGGAKRKLKSSFMASSKMFFGVGSTIVTTGATDVSMPSKEETGKSGSDTSSGVMVNLEDIKAWEEDLAKIEIQSRRSSDLMGFGERLKRGLGLRRSLPQAVGDGKA